jgi:predicted ATPase
MPGQAVAHWQRAGERAMRRSANREAIGHLSAGLEQLAQLPGTAENQRQELAFQRLLGQASFAAKGYASPEAINAFSRARELCTAIGDNETIIPVLTGVYLFEITGGRHHGALHTAEEVLARASETGDTSDRLVAHCLRAISRLHLGALSPARSDFEGANRCTAALSDDEAARMPYDYGLDWGACAYAYGAWCWWLLGYPDQALRMGAGGLTGAERVRHDYSRIRGLYWNSAFHALRRDWRIVEERAAASIAAAQERGLAMVAAVGRIMRGAAGAMMSPGDELVAEIREALGAYRATGARFQNTQHLTLLAEAEAACGRYEQAVAVLREARQVVEETGEHYVEAEIHRLQGNLLLAQSARATAKAEVCYKKALKVARMQQARSLELRAADCLARLWAEQGERQKAVDLLAPVCAWFSEGLDTPDLIGAKAILDHLG